MRIVRPRGSGHLGTLLAPAFHRDGHEVVVLSRRPSVKPWRVVVWDGASVGPWACAIGGADVVINLLERGFRFRYPRWPDAARDLVAQWRAAAMAA